MIVKSPNYNPHMQAPALLARLFLCAAALVLASCGSSIENRISRYPEKFARLPSEHQNLVRQGRIKEGMNKDAVYLAWGTPGSVRMGSEGGQSYESWRFVGHYPVWTDTVIIGHGRGYHGGYYYTDIVPSVGYVPYNAAEVVFKNERVSRWDRQR